MTPKFNLGTIYTTIGANEAIHANDTTPETYLDRHHCGDWGDLGDEDKAANDAALTSGGRIFSAYYLPDQTKIWIITEWDRSATTILLPSEY